MPVELLNEPLIIQQYGTDWGAIAAIISTVIAAISLWFTAKSSALQRQIRKEDRDEEREIRRQDLEHDQQLMEQDDKISKWNALFPHRLKLYTDLYDTLFAFVNYKIQTKPHLNYTNMPVADKEKTIAGLIDFYKLFNKYDEEAKMLFGFDVSTKVHEIYLISKQTLDDLGCNPQVSNIAPVKLSIDTIKDKLAEYQNELKVRKLEPELRESFKRYLQFENIQNCTLEQL